MGPYGQTKGKASPGWFGRGTLEGHPGPFSVTAVLGIPPAAPEVKRPSQLGWCWSGPATPDVPGLQRPSRVDHSGAGPSLGHLQLS